MKDFFYGVIEGFYGRQWSWKQREQYAEFLAQHGFDCYIYAPKGDTLLRSEWRVQYPVEIAQQLAVLGEKYTDAGVRWGIGLSPLGLSHQYTANDCRQLQQKVQAINEWKPDILCILFDDTQGDIKELATRQLDITRDILAVSHAKQHIVCPTYYSYDPALEQVFGKIPERYFETLGQGLASDVGVFWTGNQVISQQYTQEDLQKITQSFNRRPILWDNYPVNDGKVTSNFLHLRPYTGRPYQLKNWSAGHIVNPMNQPYLSQLVLQSLEKVYELNEQYDDELAFQSGLDKYVSKRLGDTIKMDWQMFQTLGLSVLDSKQRQQIKKKYQDFDEPLADEIIEWLEGGYQFDPQCLTG